MTPRIDNRTARHIVLHLQGLTRPPQRALATGELSELIEQLGFVQMDSIRWVERAHHMILAARSQAYRCCHLERLHHKQADLFENWTHDASLIPVKFWPYWKHKFSRDRQRLKRGFRTWQGRGFEDHLDALKDRIQREGPIRARDLERPKGVKLEMWEWHDGKAALEYLWRTGELSVPRREGFQKTYDLSERVIPAKHREATVSYEEFVDWACSSALERLGFGSAGDIARYWDLVSIDEVKDWLQSDGKNRTMPMEVECHDKSENRQFNARTDLFEIVAGLPKIPGRMRALSPFDPVVRDRKRLNWLFGYDYRIEIYVPPEKRKYGYYVFPLLERDRLIGRIDMQARRADDLLHVTRLWLEPGVKWSATRNDKLQSELVRQGRICGVGQIDWDEARIVNSMPVD